MFSLELHDEELRAALDRLETGLSDMSEVMNDIGEPWAESHQQRIEKSMGAPDGTAWAAKSPFTRSKDPRPLYNTGDMVSRIHHIYGPDFVSVVATGLQVRTLHFGAAKGAFGQTKTGLPIPFGDIPARPFMGLSPTNQSDIADALSEWIERLALGG